MKRIDINMITKTPVGIIDYAKDGTTYIKEIKIIIGNKMYKVPYLPANGFNGMMRRIGTDILLQAALPKGIKLTPKDFSLMNNGGGVDQQKKADQPKVKQESKPESKAEKPAKKTKDTKSVFLIKKLNPVMSIFGAGLTVSAKIAINNFMPSHEDIEGNAWAESENSTIIGSKLIQDMTITRHDDLISLDGNAVKTFTQEELQEYAEAVSSSKKNDMVQTQMILTKKYIVPGTTFYSSIMQLPDRDAMEEYEYGFLLKIIEKLAVSRIGSTKKIGWGVVNYEMYNHTENDPFLTAISDDKYSFNIKLKPEYTDEQKKAMAEADKWLNNITAENINVSKYLEASPSAEEE